MSHGGTFQPPAALPITADVSDIGRLRVKLRPDEFVQVGEAVVTYLEREGDSVYVSFAAPRSVPIVRSGQLTDDERERVSRRYRCG